MGTTVNGDFCTKLAGESLSASQYRFVTLAGDTVVRSTTADKAYGILQNAPASGEKALVKCFGESLLETTSGGGLTVNTLIAPNATTGIGRLATTGDFVRGIVTKATTSTTGLVTVRLFDSAIAL
jgi:hypothetical protein